MMLPQYTQEMFIVPAGPAHPKHAPSEAEWAAHQSEITRLYIREDESLDDIMKEMGTKHSFHATKSQYERHFKEWGLRRNLKQDEWQIVGIHVKKRERLKKKSEVYLPGGRKLSEKAVRKALSRYCPSNSAHRVRRARTPPLPQNIMLRTPSPVPRTLKPTCSSSAAFTTFPLVPSQQRVRDEITRALKASDYSADPVITASFRGSFNQSVPPNVGGDASISFQVPDAFWEEILVKILPGVSQFLEGNTWLADGQVPNPENTELILADIRSCQVGYSRSAKAAPEILMLLTFLASNSLGSDKANVAKFMVRLIEATKAEHIIGKILCVPSPSTEALGEKLFQEAISLGNLQLLRVLLDSGLDLNSQMCRFSYSKSTTPLCYAIQRGIFEVVELLLQRGADLNGHHKILDQQDLAWPLKVAIETNAYDLVKLLIENGASLESEYEKKYQTSALLVAAASRNPEIVRLLLENKAEVDFVTQKGENCLIKALPARWEIVGRDQSLVRENISDIVQQLVEAGAALDCRFPSTFGNPQPKTVLERAANLGYEEVFAYLLDRGAEMTSQCIYYAVCGGNEDMVHFLLDQELDPSSSLDNLEYPLLAAIQAGHSSIARLLIEHGAEVEPVVKGCGFRHYTPLQAACEYGDSELVSILLDRGANVNAPASLDPDDVYTDQTALSAAIDNGDEDIVCMLLDAGANAKAKPGFCGSNVLTMAIERGLKNISKRLLACGADLEAGEYGTVTALQAAISMNDAETVTNLLMAGANVNVVLREHHDYETPLTQAIEGNNYELIHRLIDGGADINNPSARLYGRTALEAAAKAGNSFLFRRLLSMGADPFDPQALLVAVEKSLDIEVIKALLEKHKLVYGQFRKGFGGTALQMAVKMKKLSVLETLLDAGIPADSVSQKSYQQPFYDRSPRSLVQGETALGTAIRLWEDEDLSQFVMKLLSYGANPSGPVVVTSSVKTALVATIESGKANLLQKLLEAGANVNASARGKLGRTALQAAAESGRLSMVRILIEHGAQVDDEPAENGGVTALQAASIGGYTVIVSLLLSKGAKINAPCAQRNGRTALEGAAEHGRIDVIQLLLDAGAAVHDEGERQYKNSVQFATKGGHSTAVRLLQRHHAASMVTSRQAPEQQLVGMDWQSGSELGAGQTLSHDTAPNFSFNEYISPPSFTQPDGAAAEPSTACWDISFPLPSIGENNPVTAPVLSTPSFDIAADFDYPIMDIEDILHTFERGQPPEQFFGTSF